MNDRSGEEELLEFLYACPVGLIACDSGGAISMLNPHAMQHLLPLAGVRDAGNLFAALERHAPELRGMVGAFPNTTGRICDGHRIFVDLGRGRRQVPLVLACTIVKLGPDRLMATLSDISQQVAQEERLRQADMWFAALLDGVGDYAALTVDRDGRITFANSCFTRQTGHDCAAVIGRDLAEVLDRDPTGGGGGLRFADQLEIAERDGWHLLEGWQHRTDGERYWCQRLVVARSDAELPRPTHFSIVLRHVPRQAAAVTDLHRLLTCDPLTGASNRRHFAQVMEREQARWHASRQPLSLIVADLDHFKAVNDGYGHPVGDLLLCRVVEACSALLPAHAVFARLGGEEFGALLPRCDEVQALALAERMRAAIADLRLDTAHGPLTVTASLGCATLEEAGGSVDALIELADQRLYAAKKDGRNRVHRPRPRAA